MKTPSSLNLLNGILESSKESVIFALDSNYCYLTFNENHRQTMKNIWDVDIQVGDNMLDFIKYQEDRSKAKANFDRALNGESFAVVEKYGDASINRRCYQNEYNPLYDDSGTIIGLTVFLSDITERKQAEESIYYLAFHDNLTDLYNRNYFEKELINIDNEKQLPLGIIMVDINGLKLINDTYGQNVGNEVLKSAANIIRKSCRENDIIIRWGGDEFVILLPKTNQAELALFINDCRILKLTLFSFSFNHHLILHLHKILPRSF